MKDYKKIVATGLVALSILSTGVINALAAPTYNFNNYLGVGKKFTTWEMTKENNGNTWSGQWRLRVNGSKAHGALVQITGELRKGMISKGGTQTAREGKGSVWANNNAKKGDRVHLSARRTDARGKKEDCTVWGTWSSDRT